MTAARIIASVFGIGYIEKGAGTVAALFYCAVWWFGGISLWPWWQQLLLILLVLSVGIWSGNEVEKGWGHDSNRVVIDEVLGMAVALFLMPYNLWVLIAAFVLFRVFDIWKPLGIRRMEDLPSGTGVMMDDVLAGVYSRVILHIALYLSLHLNLFSHS